MNIDETSCRLLSVHQIGWVRRGVKQAQLQGNTREATTFTVVFSMDHGPLDMLVQIVKAGKTDAVLPEQPWPERTHHVTSENGYGDHDPAADGHSGQRAEPGHGRTSVDPSLGHGQHPRQRGHPGRHEGRFPTRRSVLDSTFEGLAELVCEVRFAEELDVQRQGMRKGLANTGPFTVDGLFIGEEQQQQQQQQQRAGESSAQKLSLENELAVKNQFGRLHGSALQEQEVPSHPRVRRLQQAQRATRSLTTFLSGFLD